ncbi:MAG TPA: TetR/AcrR family transcriptional regulator [Acidimicrobiales bacterium]|nr:TetR/AcrR family transcriptional regulator [Acidimicrobiales bacterium]
MPGRSPSAFPGAVRQRRSDTGEATRRRLLDASERLIAKYGIDSVTVRDITAAAKTDVTAIHYHFGSKDHLIEATVRRALDALNALRAPLIDELDANGTPTTRDIARCLVVPAVHVHGTPRPRQRHAVVAAASRHTVFVAVVLEGTEKNIGRYLSALERALPGLSSSILLGRLHYAHTLIHNAQGPGSQLTQKWFEQHSARPSKDPTDALIDFVAGGFAGTQSRQ